VWAKKWVNSRKEETPIHPANIEEFVLSSLLAYNLIREGLHPQWLEWSTPHLKIRLIQTNPYITIELSSTPK